MRTPSMVTVIFIAGAAMSGCSAHVTEGPPAWLLLTHAYTARNDALIGRYTESNIASVRMYARALHDLSQRNVHALRQDGKECASNNPLNDNDAAAQFGCLLATASGMSIAGRRKQYYVWMHKADQFYMHHRAAVRRGTHERDPANIEKIRLPTMSELATLPSERIKVTNNWSTVPLDGGLAQARVDNIPIKMLIDTGSTGVLLSTHDIERLDLESKLIPANITSSMKTLTGNVSSGVYFVKRLQIGPIFIKDAYVNVRTAAHSSVGWDILSAMEKFTITKTSIVRNPPAHGLFCGSMLFARFPVAQAITEPFMVVPTSVGNLGLSLDTGLQPVKNFYDASVYFAHDVGRKLVDRGAVTRVKATTTPFTEYGKVAALKTWLFSMEIAGVPTRAFVLGKNFSDPMVAGAMDAAVLRWASISYDFPRKQMCIATK